jgi:hypothetical protein
VAASAVVALVALGLVAYAFAQLRTCDEVSQVGRRSYQYRLCNVDKEFISKVPVVAPVDEPRFSWRYADGMKPGRWRLEYQSHSVPADVRAAVQSGLESAGFALQRGEAMRKELGEGYEWWFDGHSAIGLALTPGAGGNGTKVDVFHNTGHD